MKDLFTLDIKNYLPQWNKEKRDSSRGIIIAKEKKVLPFSPDDKISLVFAKNQGYYKFPGGDINSDKAYIYGLKAYIYGLLDSYESVQETAVLLIKHYELNIVNSLRFQAILHYI